MCGRYLQTATPAQLQARFGLLALPRAVAPRYNIAPSQEAPVVVERGSRRLELLRWGLIPSWAKDPAVGGRLINARAETLLEKPSFKRPFQRSRCLVPADGFYEWRADRGSRTKTPMLIALKTREPFAMAGLWDAWEAPDKTVVRSFTIITTAANEALRPIHERMPVILPPDAERAWLDPSLTDAAELSGLLRPCEHGLLETCEVTRLLNSPQNNFPAYLT